MRLSLKDLFAILTFVAVMAWCAGEAGVDNWPFWITVLAAVAASALFVRLASSERGRWLTLLIPPLILFFCMMPLGSMALLYALGLLFVVGIVCAILPQLRVRSLIALVMVLMAVAFVGANLEGRARVAELRALRQEFPIVSIADRLAYEKASTTPRSPFLTPAIAKRLADMEQGLHFGSYRHHMLERLHDRQYERFVRASGFGVWRMVRPNRVRMARAPLREIPFDERLEDNYRPAVFDWNAAWDSGKAKSNDLDHLHVVTRADFLDPDGFGAALTPRTQIAGFIEHAMHYPPTSLLEDPNAWQIERLELVSLLKYDDPCVYVLDHLPRMDQLSGNDVPTRLLDEFEAGALAKLRTDEDVVIAEVAGATRMLGSLRVATQCLDCHNAQRGELLGAFTYVLRRDRAAELDLSISPVANAKSSR